MGAWGDEVLGRGKGDWQQGERPQPSIRHRRSETERKTRQPSVMQGKDAAEAATKDAGQTSRSGGAVGRMERV